jgi:outer membrane immunogenic protein
MKTLLLAGSAAIIASGAAIAQQPAPVQETGFNLGAGYQYTDVGGNGYHNALFRTGYEINEFFAVEGDLTLPLGDETVTVNGVEHDSAFDYSLGAFAKAQYPVTETINVFARGGYTYANVRGTFLGGRQVDDVDGWAWGGGAEWAFAGPNALRFDYTHADYVNDNGVSDSYAVSYVRRF